MRALWRCCFRPRRHLGGGAAAGPSTGGLTLLYLPFTIITLLAFGFWLPVVIALMILYPGLDKVFKLEETLSARRDAEIEERIAESQPTFHNK